MKPAKEWVYEIAFAMTMQQQLDSDRLPELLELKVRAIQVDGAADMRERAKTLALEMACASKMTLSERYLLNVLCEKIAALPVEST